jgi:hypothetical protein
MAFPTKIYCENQSSERIMPRNAARDLRDCGQKQFTCFFATNLSPWNQKRWWRCIIPESISILPRWECDHSRAQLAAPCGQFCDLTQIPCIWPSTRTTPSTDISSMWSNLLLKTCHLRNLVHNSPFGEEMAQICVIRMT